jgi:hypothetical protein
VPLPGSPPVPANRVHLRADGKVIFDLKRTWKGNVLQLVFEPLAFLARLAALVPPPRFHLTTFFGIFSSGCLYRSLVVPVPRLPDVSDRPAGHLRAHGSLIRMERSPICPLVRNTRSATLRGHVLAQEGAGAILEDSE